VECFRWSASRGRGELVDLRWRVDAELFEDGRLGWADLGALAESACRAGEGADGDLAELAAQFRPGVPGGVLGDAGRQEGEPAQDDVGADALFFPVVDRPQVDDLLEVAPVPQLRGPDSPLCHPPRPGHLHQQRSRAHHPASKSATAQLRRMLAHFPRTRRLRDDPVLPVRRCQVGISQLDALRDLFHGHA
jgi:hypothetical protein